MELESSELSLSMKKQDEQVTQQKNFIIKQVKQSKNTIEGPVRVNKSSNVIDILTKNALHSERSKSTNKCN
jgi:hypothetical protein